jgi:hypothetical protein
VLPCAEASEMMLERPDIPEFVLHALHDVEEKLPPTAEPDTVLEFIHLFGFDDAHEWLEGHRGLYFVAPDRRSHARST